MFSPIFCSRHVPVTLWLRQVEDTLWGVPSTSKEADLPNSPSMPEVFSRRAGARQGKVTQHGTKRQSDVTWSEKIVEDAR
ncbi:hypothetical protein J3D43_004761 [Paenibacillus xylanexedens]|uniref:hypothetical protein n=1 Tax=Paenibacillus xylanexedens TaxID=528191 RepID=UPI0020A03554|nr:hypothetical protein [Paenibacillus xylanexedens]MCP1426245.1 hypothetical protein [Paenibacillus xylanexedens]